VKDVAMANVLSIKKGTNEIFNIGCDTKTSVNELYCMITSLASVNIPPVSMPARAGDIRHSRLSNTKAAIILGWHPSFDLHTGLSETLKYHEEI
jgi:UDP-glucose 4-epimerase